MFRRRSFEIVAQRGHALYCRRTVRQANMVAKAVTTARNKVHRLRRGRPRAARNGFGIGRLQAWDTSLLPPCSTALLVAQLLELDVHRRASDTSTTVTKCRHRWAFRYTELVESRHALQHTLYVRISAEYFTKFTIRMKIYR